MTDVTMRDLLKSGVHYGHHPRYWNPQMAEYIYGIHNKVHIIDLEQTMPLFNDALNFIGSIAARKGKVLFVGTKRAAGEVIREQAARCDMPYVDYRWLGGLLTNYRTVRQSIKRLKDLEVLIEQKRFGGMTKKEILGLNREQTKLQRCFNGIKNMNGIPDALFIIDVGHEKIAVNEAVKLRIPVIGVVDTNNSPDNIDYIVPGNDDAIRAIKLYTQTAADVILAAKTEVAENQAAKAEPAIAVKPAVEEISAAPIGEEPGSGDDSKQDEAS